MKQHTTPEQTAKLIELGFEKPKGGISKRVSYFDDRLNRKCRYEISKFNYSIGELLSILPSTVREVYDLHIESSLTKWYVAYYWIGYDGEYYIKYEFYACELIDTLYMMILRLKEEGVI